MSPARRHRRLTERAIWGTIGVALVIHAALLGSVQAFGLTVVGAGFSPESDPNRTQDDVAVAEAPDLKTTCSGDVLLATGARASMCLAPWNADVPGCGGDVVMAMWIDLSSCTGNDDKDPDHGKQAIALLDKRTDKIKEIDPERLMDEMQPEQPKPKPPDPIPPVTPQNQPPPPPQPPAPPRPTQVVETVKPNTEKEPDNARFVSENNVVVEKQKVARGTAQEAMVAKPKDADLTPKQQPKDASIQKQEDLDRGKNPKAPAVPGTLAMRPPGTPEPSPAPQEAREKGSVTGEKGPIVADGFVPRRGDGMIEQDRREAGDEARGQSGAGGGAPNVPNLKPTPEMLERAVGGGSVDHLDDVDSGDETALNSKRWIYASFFNRMKRQVAQNWDPASVWRRVDPDGTVNGFKTRVTEVRVQLSAKGELQKIVVTAPSGVSDLDDEAVRAFHSAAPFPNPPDGLANKDGQITFAFSFYFEIGQSHTSWRFNRSM